MIDYLAHRSHKYIKKEMKNGKMRYYYTDKKTVDTTYQNTNSLFNKTETRKYPMSGYEHVTKSRGKISQNIDKLVDKGKSFIDKNYSGVDLYDMGATTTKTVTTVHRDTGKFFDKTTKTGSPGNEKIVKARGKLSRKIDRGKKYIQSLFD